ncbi:MAG: amidohydrolase family protein [Termitinemataceae bacterium]|nr:MAG: amidohydrolase family protein [Termitinemataceae bacterium]
MNWRLKNGVIVSPHSEPRGGSLGVCGDTIDASAADDCIVCDLEKCSYVYPALINTHDHLRGNYQPRCGPKPGNYYLNWLPWDNDLKASPCYAERTKALPIDESYLLSSYKTLFSGIATVSDHFPHKLNKSILPTLPIRAVEKYAIAHECSSFELQWGDDLASEYQYAVQNECPFITHIAEGFDTETMDTLSKLDRIGILDDHSLLVHCLAFTDDDIKKTAAANASISWCGASNIFMFGTTAKIRKFMIAGVNVTLGTDSAHTGSENILAEMKYDRELYRNMYGEDLSAKKIFEMVTINSAKAFWMQDKIGTLENGKLADVLVVKGRNSNPYENLVNASMDDIELLTVGGTPVYGEERFLNLLGGKLQPNYTMIKVGTKNKFRDMFVIGDPNALYNRIRSKVGFKKMLSFLPFEPDFQTSNKNA